MKPRCDEARGLPLRPARPAMPGEIFFDPAAFNAGYASRVLVQRRQGRFGVNNIIYIVGLVVVVIAVLSFFGLR